MRTFLTTLCFLLLACPGFAKDNPPNVLFLAVDDLNNWVGCLGGHPQAKTPNIDALAKKGVLFEQAYCAAPLCHPRGHASASGAEDVDPTRVGRTRDGGAVTVDGVARRDGRHQARRRQARRQPARHGSEGGGTVKAAPSMYQAWIRGKQRHY